MKIEQYTDTDTKPLIQILYTAVHNICTTFYDEEQKWAWAPKSILDQPIKLNKTWSYIVDDTIAGYIDFIEECGYINHLYIHPNYQNERKASLLYQTVEDYAITRNSTKLKVDASKVALSFFLRKGFIIEKENTVERNGVKLINFTLFKNIS